MVYKKENLDQGTGYLGAPRKGSINASTFMPLYNELSNS